MRSDGCNSIVYVASDNHIHELTDFNGSLADWDLFVASGATGVIPISDPWGYSRADSCNAVVFMAMNDSKVHELTLCPGQGWQSWTLPSINSVAGMSGRPSGYVRADGVSAVVYRDTSSIIHELKLQNGSWTDGTLSTPGVASISQLFGHPAPGSRSSVLFQGTRLGVWHRYELSQAVGGQWGLQEF